MTCGRPTRILPDDDKLPCGTRLFWGQDFKTRRMSVLLCDKCKAEEEMTAPNKT